MKKFHYKLLEKIGIVGMAEVFRADLLKGGNTMERKRMGLIFVALCLALAFSVSPVEAEHGMCVNREGVEFEFGLLDPNRCDRDRDCFLKENRRCVSLNQETLDQMPQLLFIDCDDNFFDPENECFTGEGSMAMVDVEFVGWGGPNKDNHIQVRVHVRDEFFRAVEAFVEIDVNLDGVPLEDDPLIGTTSLDDGGLLRVNIQNAPLGCYTTTVNELVLPDHLDWDGTSTQEPDPFSKPQGLVCP